MPGRPTFDLQSHSTRSDGALAPGEVVRSAAGAGVELLALTDHDTVAGVGEAMATGRELGLRVVAAAELSAIDRGERDLHILGYGIDPANSGLADSLATFRADRHRRAERMAQALRGLGLELDQAVIATREQDGLPVGRPHLAAAVLACPGNAERLAAEGLNDADSVLQAYLIDGRPAFRPRLVPSVKEAVAAVHDAGGVAVWAHPFWDVKDPRDVLDTIERFRTLGMDGVEAFYATHTREQTELVADRCAELGMLTTGSADFHGPEHRVFSRFRAFETFGREPNLGPITG
jgi:predicted metal-dependent phosphoesterase TrpH